MKPLHVAAVLLFIGGCFVAAQYQPPSGGGGAAVWGSITGTLSSQSDLNTALGGKQPTISGAPGTWPSFATVATSGSASDLGAGTLPFARLPNQPSYGTFASLGTCNSGASGTSYYFSNSIYTMAYCDGSSWHYFGPGGALTPPVLSNFGTSVNSPTTVATNGGIQITAPAHSGDLYRMVCKALPSTPYTIDASLTSPNPAVQYLPVALALYDGTKLAVIGSYVDCQGTNPCTGGTTTVGTASTSIKTAKLNTTSSFNAAYAATTIGWGTQQGPQFTLRLADDGTNRTMSYAMDCCTFTAVTTVGNTDFLTPTQVCLAADSNNTTFASTAWFYHYKEH